MTTTKRLAAMIVLCIAAGSAHAQEIAIPEHNRAELTEAPPRPGAGDVEERMRRLFDAIRADTPETAMELFLSREAFRAIKGIADPDALHARIVGMYESDIHALHASIFGAGTSAEFVRFEFSRRRAWVRVREESNRLPYWAQRHNAIVYRVGAEERRIEVRTMIAWDDRWYITHLSEFR